MTATGQECRLIGWIRPKYVFNRLKADVISEAWLENDPPQWLLSYQHDCCRSKTAVWSAQRFVRSALDSRRGGSQRVVRLRNLFDDLTRTQQKLFRDSQAQWFGGSQIDNEIKLGWLLDRQVGRPDVKLRPLQLSNPQELPKVPLRLSASP